MVKVATRQGHRAIRAVLWAFLGVVAPGIIGVAALVPDHSGDRVRAEAAEAALIGAQAVEAAWEAELDGDEPFGRSVAFALPIEPMGTRRQARSPSEEDRLRWLARRAGLGEGNAAAARELARIVAACEPFAADAAVELAWLVAEGVAEPSALIEILARLDFDQQTSRGVEARLLALMVARERLDRDIVSAELEELRAAVVAEGIDVDDGARAVDGRFAFVEAPAWQAWRELLAEAFPEIAVDGAFALETRRLRTIARAAATVIARDEPRWTPLEVASSAEVLLARIVERSVHVTPIDAAEVDAFLVSRAPGAVAWQWTLHAFETGKDAESTPTLAVTAALAGTGTSARLHASALDARIADARREVLWLRLAAIVVALALAAAAVTTLRTLRETERLWRLRSTFVASVSHDLRTPVAAIGLMAQNLGAGHVRGRESVYADALRSEADRLARLVDDLLDFGRIERGLPAKVVRERVDVARWLAEFTASEVRKCAARDRALGVTLADLPAAATLDQLAIERAVSNLVDNALAHASASRIELVVMGLDEGRTLRIDVLDEGVGIAAARIDALFEPFARGETTAAGTGLGLAIVRSIAESHGGSAALCRRDDGTPGMRARIELPTRTEDAA